MKKIVLEILRQIFTAAGIGLIVYGCYLIWQPLGWLVAGLFVIRYRNDRLSGPTYWIHDNKQNPDDQSSLQIIRAADFKGEKNPGAYWYKVRLNPSFAEHWRDNKNV